MSLAVEASAYRSDMLKYRDAEERYYRQLEGRTSCASDSGKSSAVEGIKQARKAIADTLASGMHSLTLSDGTHSDAALVARVEQLEKQNAKMGNEMTDLRRLVEKLEQQVKSLSGGAASVPSTKPAPAAAAAAKKGGDDDEDIDLFGSDEEEDEAKEKLKEERLKAYAAKKQAKPGPIAKSSIIFDVKPWDDETDLVAMEKLVRSIKMDGLVWGASKLVPLAYTIKKLQIMCVVEDEKVSVEELQETIEGFEDVVQSVDIAAFNKI